MGKKYIVEIGRLERLYKAYVNENGKPNLTWLSPEVDLTPYTEPDMEQVRKEAYEDGYKTAKVQCNIQAEKDMREVGERHYQRGLADAKCGYENGFENGMIVAWDAAKKIALMDTETSENVTGYFGLFRIMENLTPMQAIEKIRQYEQEQEEQITKGDIVLIKSTPEVEILVTYADEEYVSGIALTEVDGNCEIGDQYTNIRISNVEKTGKHYDIVSVLQKMREESNG